MTHKYRADIDGLRAIAVLSVVLYHFGVPGIIGGFIGVDVFFVISGFLITKIIASEVDANQFSFVQFYDRRIRRIFPALFVVLFSTLIASWFILLPSDMQRLGYNAIATLLFVSNFLFWRQSGYFDVQSDYNPLLHTWSLAVEEQFYVFFPILLIFICRFARGYLMPILVIMLVVSFLLCALLQQRFSGATFYLSPFRAWELLAGSILAIGKFPQPKNRAVNEALALASLAALVACFALIKEDINFPGWIAAAPVLATVLLIYTGSGTETMVSGFLGSRAFVFVGLISYSLYLWHWPVFVFASYTNGYADFSSSTIVGLVLLSMLLAYLTYRWVESPFRKRGPGAIFHGHRQVFGAALFASAALGLLAFGATWDNGWRSRVSSKIATLDAMRNSPIPGQECNGLVPDGMLTACNATNVGERTDMLLWGDSHAMAWSPALQELSKESNMQLALAVNSACPPLLGVDNPAARDCAKFNGNVFDYVKNTRPASIYLVASWISYSSPDGQYEISGGGETGNTRLFTPALQRTITAILPYTDRIILVGPTPGAPLEIPYRLAAFEWKKWGDRPDPVTAAQFDRQVQWFENAVNSLQRDDKIVTIDPAPWFCDVNQCIYETNTALLYKDSGHLSIDGASFVKNKLKHSIASTIIPAMPAAAR